MGIGAIRIGRPSPAATQLRSCSRGSRRGRVALAGIVVAGAMLAAPSTSPAAIDFGNNLSTASAGASIQCPDTCTVFAVTLPPANTAAGGLTSPISGVVVSFTLKKRAPGMMEPPWSPIHLRVVHQISGNSWNGFTPSTPDVTPTGVAGEESFPVRLPITAGDYVAIESDAAITNIYSLGNLAGAAFRFSSPKLPADNSAGTAGVFPGTFEVLLRARVEADADGDGYGDETQDQCPTSASTQSACPTAPSTSTGQRAAALKKCKKKKSAKARKKCKKKANLLPV